MNDYLHAGIIFVALLMLVFAIKIGLDLYEETSYCNMNGDLVCFNPVLGTDGFWLEFGNDAKEDIYIQDITISQKNGPKCIFVKTEIVNPDMDYYYTIPAGKVQPFFTSKEHPDGFCLINGMIANNDYKFVLEITYFLNGEKKISNGKGKVFFSDLKILPDYDNDSLIN